MGQVVTYDKMKVGAKGGGKHWTRNQVQARTVAGQKVKPKKRKKLRMPGWLDEAAQAVWKKTLKNMQDYEILEKADEDVLAVYCDAVARYRELTVEIAGEKKYTTVNGQGTETVSPQVRAAQSYARIVQQYAERLGLTANARARLAKKIAEKEDDPNAALFD